MKTQLTVLCLLAVPILAFAQKPAGVLGVNNVYVYGIYETENAPSDDNSEYGGCGLGISQNLFESEQFGMDAGLNFEYWTNFTNDDYYDYNGRNYTGSITGYMKGKFAPFVTAMLNWNNTSGYHYSGYESTWGAAKLGVECHVVNGFYITPSVTYWSELDSDSGSKSTEWSYCIEAGYWFTDKLLGFVNVNYEKEDGYTIYWYALGAAWHY
jgi:hypothetical protein